MRDFPREMPRESPMRVVVSATRALVRANASNALIATLIVASIAVPFGAPARALAQRSAPNPDFGPNVSIFDPTMRDGDIQAALDSAFRTQEGSEFGSARLAFLFKPGHYDVDAHVGFYTQLSGLGLSPDDVVINGGVRADAKWR